MRGGFPLPSERSSCCVCVLSSGVRLRGHLWSWSTLCTPTTTLGGHSCAVGCRDGCSCNCYPLSLSAALKPSLTGGQSSPKLAETLSSSFQLLRVRTRQAPTFLSSYDPCSRGFGGCDAPGRQGSSAAHPISVKSRLVGPRV